MYFWNKLLTYLLTPSLKGPLLAGSHLSPVTTIGKYT